MMLNFIAKLFEKVPDLYDDLYFSNYKSRIRHSIEFYGPFSDETNEAVKKAGELLKRCYIEEYPLCKDYHIASRDGNYYLKLGQLWDKI